MKPASPESSMDISQWCLPPARQHAGSDDALAGASGARMVVIKTSNTAMDTVRLMSRRILAHRLLL